MIDGWQTVQLGDVLQRVKAELAIDDSMTYKQVTVRLWNKGVTLRGEQEGIAIKTKRQFYVKTGQLVLSRIDVRNGAIGLVPKELDGAIVSNDFWVYDINEDKLLSKFLVHYVTTPSFTEDANRTSSGTTNRIRADETTFLKIEIPLPPLDEQRRIVERIEGIAPRISKAQSLREDADEETELLFFNTISNLSIAEKDWSTVGTLLSSQKGSIHSGPFGSDLTHDQFVESGVAAIGTRDVQVNRFSMTRGWFVTPERFESLKQYQIHPNDVLVTIIGGSIGRFCVVPEDVPLAFTTKHIIAMKFDPALVLPAFASYLLNYHRRCRETMFSQTAGSAQPSLNASKVKAIHFPKLSLDEQRRIVAYLDSFQARLVSLRELQSQTGEELDALLPSVLDMAFKGEL